MRTIIANRRLAALRKQSLQPHIWGAPVGESGNAKIVNEDLASSATLGLGDALDDFQPSVTDFGSAVSRPTVRGLTETG